MSGWEPDAIAPSGQYGFVNHPSDEIQVVQRFSNGSWGPTPARYRRETLAARADGVELAIDFGNNWVLAAADATALNAFARAAA